METNKSYIHLLDFRQLVGPVAGVPRVAVEFRELMLRPAMSGNESSRRRISRLVAFVGQGVMQTIVKRAVIA